MVRPIPFDNLLTRLIDDSQDVVLLWQVGVLAACAVVAWGVMRLLKPHLAKHPEDRDAMWTAGRAGMRRVGFALAMLLALLLGRDVAGVWLANTHLLNLAVQLLLSWMGVRLVIYALRYVFEPCESLKVWERSAAWLIWGAFALHITGLLPRIHAAMEALSFQSGSHRFSLCNTFCGSALSRTVYALQCDQLALHRFLTCGGAEIKLSLQWFWRNKWKMEIYAVARY